MYTKHTIIVLHNQILPNSPEDVLDIERQANWIEEILREKGYRTLLLPFSLDALSLLETMNKDKAVLVFNLTDSAPGEENLAYLVPGILEHMGLPYTGCSLQNLFITTNKMLTKRILKAGGIDTPPWVCKDETEALKENSIRRYIIKPISEDASIGLDDSSIVSAKSVVSELKAKEEAMNTPCFAEAFIEGREFTACMYSEFLDSCT